MRTTEDPENSVGELVSSQQSVGFYNPHCAPALVDFSVVRSEPAPELFGDVPARVLPVQKQHSLLACRLELLATPRKEPRAYRTQRPPIYEPQPRLPVELGQIEAPQQDMAFASGSSLWEWSAGGDARASLPRSSYSESARPPCSTRALLQETHRPLRTGLGEANQSVAASFSLLQRVGGADRALRPLPLHSEKAPERRPDPLAADPPLPYSFLEGNLGGHRERPEAPLPAKLSRRTMQQPPQSLRAFLLEGIAGSRRGREDLAARASTPLR